jgi:hypothetical protein
MENIDLWIIRQCSLLIILTFLENFFSVFRGRILEAINQQKQSESLAG